ncbi:MAG TPA: site-2 protease family protein [Gammaproteobacteria bacterium]
MNQLLFALALALGMVLAIMAWRRAYLYAFLRRMRFGMASGLETDRDAFPAEARVVLDEVAGQLVALGFERVGSRATAPTVKNGKGLLYHDYYLHRATSTFANVFPSDTPEPGAIAAISFETWLADGRAAFTVNRRRHLLLPVPESFLLDDGYLGSAAEQWQLHQKRLETIAGERVADYDEMVQRNDALVREMADSWLNQGVMQPVSENEWRLTHQGAMSHMIRLLAGNKRVAALSSLAASAPLEARVCADLMCYRASEPLHRQGVLGRTGKVVLFVVSAILGAVAFGLAFSWEIVPILMGVLLFHEFGHALAMRATGYRNVQVLVLPFLGAVASGHKDDASHWAKLLVLLAGPLPGLIVSIIILHAIGDEAASHPLLLQIALMSLVLNLFNLLPFTPLDGGQIVETFLFARWPLFRFVFFILSCVVLIVVGEWLDSVALMAVALLLLMSSRRFLAIYRMAQHIGPSTREDAPRAILTALHERYAHTAKHLAQRVQILRGVLPLVLARPLTRRDSLFGVAIYIAVLALPVSSLLNISAARQTFASLLHLPQAGAVTQRDWDAELARAATVDERWRILNEAGYWEEETNYELEAAHRRYQQALVIAQGFPAGDFRLLDTRMALARTSVDRGVALAGYRQLLGEASQLQGAARLRFAEIKEAIFWLDEEAPADLRMGYLREALAVREAIEYKSYMIASDHEQIARLLYRQGDYSRSEDELRLGLDANDKAHQALPLIWWLIDRDRSAEAEGLVRHYLHLENRGSYNTIHLSDALAWALFIQGKGAQGYSILENLVITDKSVHPWQRYYLMLDLIHLSGDDPKASNDWKERLKRELVKEEVGYKSLLRGLDYYDSYAPWDGRRSRARREALDSLGLSREEPLQSCS